MVMCCMSLASCSCYYRGLPGASGLDQPSKLDALSESMMDKTALNDVEVLEIHSDGKI